MAIDTRATQLSSALEQSRNVNDINSTNKLRQSSRSGSDEALREVAQQFEAIFVRMLLKTMRQAQDTLADSDNPLNSDQVKFYRDMHDQQMAVNLSTGGSLGLADVIVEQLKGSMEFHERPQQQENLKSQPITESSTNNEQPIKIEQTSAMGSKRAVFNSEQEFVEYMLPKAEKGAAELGLDPKALVAQAALETGWGEFIMHDANGDSANNLFGIKADERWGGDKVIVNTMENYGDVAEQIKAKFRSYDNFADSINDYVDFLKSNPRYSDALNKTDNPSSFFKALQEAGYATDPDYAKKLISIYQGNILNGFTR